MTEKQLREIVRTNIKRYRNYRKWTQAEFAERLDISVNFLSDIENGKRWISPRSIVKIASVLEIEPYELLKPADLSSPYIPTLFYKFKDEIAKSVNDSLEHVYGYYRTKVEAESEN